MLRALAAILVLGIATAASAHEAPSGWTYSIACCDNRDCAPIDASLVVPIDGGWYLPNSAEIIPYTSSKIKDSGDSGFHRCIYQSGKNKDQTRCLYVPPFGS